MPSLLLTILTASGVAAVASILELIIRPRDKGLYRGALPACLLYAILDSAAALMLFAALRVGAEQIQGKPTMWAAVAAGLTAPLLMRTKVSIPFVRHRVDFYALGMLRRLHLRAAAEIDDRCAAGETAWILDVVLPGIKSLPLAHVEAWVRESINVKYQGEERRRCAQELRKAAADYVSEEERKRLLIQILIDRCGRLQVKTLVKRAKKWIPEDQPPTLTIVLKPPGAVPGSNGPAPSVTASPANPPSQAIVNIDASLEPHDEQLDGAQGPDRHAARLMTTVPVLIRSVMRSISGHKSRLRAAPGWRPPAARAPAR